MIVRGADLAAELFGGGRPDGLALGSIAPLTVTLGLFFGSYPAARAARLSPITALRHE